MAVNLGILLGAKGGAQTRSEIDDVTGSVKRLDGAADGAGKGGLSSLTNMLLGGLKMAAGAALAAIGGLGAGIVTSAIAAGDMEQKVADIASVMGLAKDQTAPLASLIKDLGIDPKLKVTATEAGVAIENLAKNGLGMTDILNGAARSTVLLANATSADFGTAANVATDVMALFKIKAEDMKTAVDGIASVTIASKFGIQDYALALAQGGGVASAVGVKFNDFNTSIAAISPFFGSGSDAGTSFKVMLQNLIPKSNEAADLMRKMGLYTGLTGKEYKDVQDKIAKYRAELAELDPTSKNYEERAAKLNEKINVLNSSLTVGQNAFFDANGDMKSMADISALLANKLGGLSEEQKNATLSTLFGSDAMRAAFGLMESGQVVYTDAAKAASELGVSLDAVNTVIDGGITKYEALQLQMAKGDAEAAAATRMDTFKGVLEILGGVFETLQISIGEKFLPVFRQMAEKVIAFLSDNADGLVEWAGSLATALQGLIDTYLPAIIAQFGAWFAWGKSAAEALGSLAGTVATLWGAIAAILQPIVDTITQFVSLRDVGIAVGALLAYVLIPVLSSFVAAWAPVVLAVAGAVAAVAALRYGWETDFGGIRTAVQTAIDYVQARFGPLLDTIRTFGAQALGEITAWVTGNSTQFTAVAAIWDKAKAVGTAFFADMTNYIASKLPEWVEKLRGWGVALVAWIAEAIPPTVAKVTEWGGKILAWITDNLPVWIAKLKEWSAAAWGWIVDATAATVAKVGEWGGKILAWVGDNLPGWVAKLKEWGVAAWAWIVDATQITVAKVTEWGGKILAWVDDNLPGWIEKLKEWSVAAWDWIADAIPSAIALMGEWGRQLLGWITDNLPGWVAKLKQWGNEAWRWLVEATQTTVAKVTEWGGKILAWVTDNLPAWTDKLKEWSKAAWQWIVDAIPATIALIGEWGRQLMAWLMDNLPGWLAKLGEWGAAIVAWIGDAIPLAVAKVGEWGSKLLDWVADNRQGWADSFIEWGAALVAWIREAIPPTVAKIAEWGSKVLAWVTDNLPDWVAKLKEWGGAAWNWLVEARQTTVAKLGEWGGALTKWLGEHLPDLVESFLKWETEMVKWIGDTIPDAIAAFGDWLTAILDWDDEQATPALASTAGDWAKTLIDWVANDLIPKVGPAFLDFSGAMVKAVGKIVVELTAAALKIGVAIIAAIAEGIADMVGVDLALGDLKKNIIDTIDNWRAAIYGAGAAVTRRIGEGIRSLLSDPQGAINSVIDNARSSADSLMTTWSTNLKAQGAAAVTKLQEGVASVKEAVRGEVAKTLKDIEDYGLTEGLGKLAGRMYDAAKQGLTNFAAGFTNQSPTAKADLQAVLTGVQSAISSGLDGISKSLTDWAGPAATKFYNSARELINKFLDGWSSNKFNLGEWTGGISGSLTAWLTNAKDDFKNAGLNLISSFLNGWGSATFDLSKWLNEGISGALRDWMSLNTNSIAQWTAGIGKSIVDGIGAGITAAAPTLQSALTYLSMLLPQWAKDALGIHSPSTVFRAIGQHIIEGLTLGIQDLAAQPQLALTAAVSSMGSDTAATLSRQSISTTNNSSVVQNYFTIAERGGGQMDIAERVRLLNMMYA